MSQGIAWSGKTPHTFGDQKCQKDCECDSRVREKERSTERKTGWFSKSLSQAGAGAQTGNWIVVIQTLLGFQKFCVMPALVICDIFVICLMYL